MNLQPISPPSRDTLKAGCRGCHGDVEMDSGFADLDAPRGAYECARCAKISLGPCKAASMIEDEQIKQMKLKGILSSKYKRI